VDAKGHKMSKSLGNVVSPQEMIDKLGTDGLRLWVASIDYTDDAVVSDVLTRNVQEVLRKIRNTCRFLLSNLYDFDIDTDAVPLEQMRLIDQYALQALFAVDQEIHAAYERYDFTAIFHAFAQYCSVDLSAFYLDIIKDRLYVETADGHARRSAQTACWHIVDTLTKLMAPILSFTAEQVSDHYQKDKSTSIHLQTFAQPDNIWQLLAKQKTGLAWRKALASRGVDSRAHETIAIVGFAAEQDQLWDMLKTMRSALLKAIEGLRQSGTIKHSLEAAITMHVAADAPYAPLLNAFYATLAQSGQTTEAFFKEFLIVSQVTIRDSADGLASSQLDGLSVQVTPATGDKCPRCWHYEPSDHEHKLCSRCQKNLG